MRRQRLSVNRKKRYIKSYGNRYYHATKRSFARNLRKQRRR